MINRHKINELSVDKLWPYIKEIDKLNVYFSEFNETENQNEHIYCNINTVYWSDKEINQRRKKKQKPAENLRWK